MNTALTHHHHSWQMQTSQLPGTAIRPLHASLNSLTKLMNLSSKNYHVGYCITFTSCQLIKANDTNLIRPWTHSFTPKCKSSFYDTGNCNFITHRLIGANFLQIVGGSCPFPSPPLPFPLLPSVPSPPLPSPLLRSRAPQIQLGSLGERCKLPQRGLGRSRSRNRIWCILALKSVIWWQQF